MGAHMTSSNIVSHTPGPWAAFSDDEGHTNIVAVVPHTTCVFSLPGHHKTEPDVQLIAAAPDLLAACKAQHEAIDELFARLIMQAAEGKSPDFYPSKSGRPWDALLQGKTAIAKAEGR